MSELPSTPSVIDCDVHITVPSVQALFPYLPYHWRHYISNSGFKGPVEGYYLPGAPTTSRADAFPPRADRLDPIWHYCVSRCWVERVSN